MIGGDKATLHISGKNNFSYFLNLPRSLIKELEQKGEKVQHLERFRVWVERTGLMAKSRPNSNFGKKQEKNDIPNSKVPKEELDKLFVLKSEGNSIEDIKYKFEKESEFSWLDLPNQIIRELEK